MSFVSSQTRELQAEEQRLITKFAQKAKSIQQNDPRLSYGAAYAKAVEELPQAYANYVTTRTQLAAQGVPPLPIDV
jgi:hypothetical protein